MAKAYSVLTHTEISDPESFAAYAAPAGPAIEAAGGRFIARSEPIQVLEGENHNRAVVIEFDSIEATNAASHCEDEQRAAQALEQGTRRDNRIAPGGLHA